MGLRLIFGSIIIKGSSSTYFFDSSLDKKVLESHPPLAEWQSGYAAACKAVDSGSIPLSASTILHP